MSTVFWKNILKCLPTTLTADPSEQDHSHPLPSSSISSSKSTIVIKNFNSLYDISSSSTSKSLISTDYSFSSSTNDPGANSESDSNSNSYSNSISPPDFSTIFASQRFFFTSPGHSNSIIQTSKAPVETASNSSSSTATPLTGGGVAVKKYSPDPYTDFKNSMQEMIEAREVKDVRANWEYLHELLSCYLALNPRQTHHIIITAFVDIIICLLSEESDKHRKVRRNKNGDGRRRRHQVSR